MSLSIAGRNGSWITQNETTTPLQFLNKYGQAYEVFKARQTDPGFPLSENDTKLLRLADAIDSHFSTNVLSPDLASSTRRKRTRT